MRDIILPRGTIVMLHGATCELQAPAVVQSEEIDRYPNLEAFLRAQEAPPDAIPPAAPSSVEVFDRAYQVRGGRVDGVPMLQLWDPRDESLFLVATVLHRQEGQHEDDVWVRAAGPGDVWLYHALRDGGLVEHFAEERRDALGHCRMLRCRLTPDGRRLVS